MRNHKLVALILFLCVCSTTLVLVKSDILAQDTKGASDEDVFKERFIRFNMAGLDAEKNISEEFSKATFDFYNFPKDFPNSKYAADVEFLKLIFTQKTFDIGEVEKFVKKYPNGRLHDLTLSLIKESYGSVANDEYIPYNLALPYFKGMKALVDDKDYAEAAKNLSEVANSLDRNNPNEKEVFLPVYYGLLLCYRELRMNSEFENTKSKVKELFPERQEKIEKIKF